MTRSPFESVPLAIVGMACRFPGGESLDEFWSLLVEGRSGFAPLWPERLDPDLHYSAERGLLGRTYATHLGQVIQRPVDPAILDIPSDLAARFDLTHLTLCEVAAAACRDAGYDPQRLPPRRTGVYLGNSSVGDLEGDVTYHVHARHIAHRLRRLPLLAGLSRGDEDRLIGDVVEALRRECPAGRGSRVESFAAGSAAGLIAGLFGIEGPAFVTDAACAASFKALLVAANALHLGRVDLAIVGAGACRSWCELVLMAIITAMTDDISRPFDAKASGLVPADGYGAVILKTLPRALDDGDRILGVVRGIGLSSDGRGKGFWAPKIEGQMECMRRAWLASGLDARSVQYVQAHATSTQLGDISEMETLAEVFRGLPAAIPVTSVKANIGHTLEAAGMAGLINTLLAMRHATIPPAANVDELNADIPWSEIPFYVPTAPVEWPRPESGPRRAGINAFGIGGLNTHVVLDDAPEPSFAGRFTPALPAGSAVQPVAPSPLAVIGIGCVLPGAHTVGQLVELLDSGSDPKTAVPASRWDASLGVEADPGEAPRPAPPGGFLADYAFDWKKHRIPPIQVANANPLQFWLVDAVDQALSDAGLGGAAKSSPSLEKDRVTTLVGAAFTHDFCNNGHLGVRIPEMTRAIGSALAAHGWDDAAVLDVTTAFTKELVAESPCLRDETGSYSSSTLASRIAKQLDFGGGAFSIDAGDASGLAAVAVAGDLLQAGYCDAVVCASGQRNMDLTRYVQLARKGTGALAPGEGAVALVLKRLDDAEREGRPIRGVIRGVSCEPASREREAEADLDFVERAGGDVPGDVLAATLGHLQGASGMAGLLKAIVQIPLGRSLGPGAPVATEAAPRRVKAAAVSGQDFGAAAPGKGLCWRVEIEGIGPWPAKETPTAGWAQNGAAGAARSPEEWLLDAVVEFTGYPRELVTVDDDLELDLRLEPERQAAFLTLVAERLHAPGLEQPPVRGRRVRTLRDLLERMGLSVD